MYHKFINSVITLYEKEGNTLNKLMQEKKYRYVILALLFVGWCLGNLDRFAINYAIVAIGQDMGFSASSQGIILSSFFLGYALMQIPGGKLADRFGYRKVILIAVFSWSVFTFFTGSAWSLLSLVVFRFLFGIGEGSFYPSGSKAIAVNFPVTQRARAMSIMLSAAKFMGIITPVLAGIALVTIGWRSFFYITGAVGILVTVLMFFFLKEPGQIPSHNAPGAAAAPKPKASLKTIIRMPMIWNLFICNFCIYAINWGLKSWMPTYMVQVRGLEIVEMGMIATIPAIVGIVSMLVSGYIIDRIPAGKDRLFAFVFAILVAIFLYFMSTASSVALFITHVSIVTVLAGYIAMLVMTKPLKTLPTSIIATANGFINTGAQLAGFITPMLIGFIVDASGGSFTIAFGTLVIFAVICAITLLFTKTNTSSKLEEANIPTPTTTM
ncbi:MFS transporter [Paenibacillus illinoisensis]|uniref:MFS transporter n=1 Tax=Paenibacillus illinoisensis TaxID=59845 RepID=UPI001FE82CB8|nr:MFS transporter [Paenibacillus illinoisensis]